MTYFVWEAEIEYFDDDTLTKSNNNSNMPKEEKTG